ncbi:unnamed protein product [Brassica rapa]|uniref:Uncharacterized protein n=1 Tax=Brassica campestris TaxID=3711 RepID=A0A3P5YAG9_BRACM|nr:unnamed protein product [Brassica rapa]VDC59605.1 unnamed protein product [Brassica rapa]
MLDPLPYSAFTNPDPIRGSETVVVLTGQFLRLVCFTSSLPFLFFTKGDVCSASIGQYTTIKRCWSM